MCCEIGHTCVHCKSGLFLFFSGEETLIMMTKDFDPISEFPCHSEEFGEGVFIVSMFIFQTLPFTACLPC